ncbi:Hypothetical protein ABZS17H1_03857 [Kosakonia cowanii]
MLSILTKYFSKSSMKTAFNGWENSEAACGYGLTQHAGS